MVGRYSGKQGATIDYIVHLLRCRQLVDSLYDHDISPQFKGILQAYCDGFNAYARTHKKEVLVKRALPLTPKDMLTYSVLQLAISCGIDGALKRIFAGAQPLANFSATEHPSEAPGHGSNGFAFNSRITTDSSVYLAINSHQPLEGPVAWYEAHLCSEEGWNILGALFPGSPVMLIGVNPYLGWTHTVNNPDKLDVYQLDINPANKLQYSIDGNWKTLEEKKVKLKVKVAFFRIGVKKKIWNSIYGPAVVTEKGTFALRTGALMDIRALEQWYHMNKAVNFHGFYNALKMEAIPGYNIVYGDRYDTIFYLSNGKLPFRDPAFSWKSTLPGNTQRTRWTSFHPLKDLPQLVNPSSGYLFNNNHSPFNATALPDNLLQRDYDPTMGFETHNNNRSMRVMELMDGRTRISYDDFKRIKYDLQLPRKLHYNSNVDSLFLLNEKDVTGELRPILTTLREWDHQAVTNSKGAAYFGILYYFVVKKLETQPEYRMLNRARSIEALAFIRDYILKNFGTTEVTLGEYQRLVRGERSLPLAGVPDVIASMLSAPYKDGRIKGIQGESYIELVRFTPSGPEIESINCYGASNHANSPHYNDQMELYLRQQTRKVSLDKDKVYQTTRWVYHPE
jgi:acyl-homoserine-lactone acylase